MTALALSRLTGRPVATGSAVAAAIARKDERVPKGLQQIIRPQASARWILPTLSAITPTYIESVLRGAFTGSHIQAWELFDLMEDTWPRLTKNLNEIKRAVVAMDWQLEPWAEEDTPPTDNAKERARLVSSALWRMQPDPCADENGFPQTIYDVLDGWGKGLSVLEILWHLRRAGQLGDITAPRATVWVRPNNYAWSQDGYLGLNPNSLDATRNTQHGTRAYLLTPSYMPARIEDLVEFPPDKFLIAIAKAKTGPCLTSALLRPLAWWWCAANFSSDWLMNLAQIFGLPLRWANYTNGASQGTVDAISAMLENMGSAGWAAFPEGTTLELKEAGNLGSNSPQADLLDRADKNCDLIILGQTLTSDTGGMGSGSGSMALGKVHAGVKEENVKAAANWAAEVINRQLIPSILRLNYGDDEEPPEFRPQTDEEEDQQALASRDTTLLGAGVKMPREWFYKRHNIPLPQEGEDVIGKPEPMPAPSPGGEGGRRPDEGGPPDRAEETDTAKALSAAEGRWITTDSGAHVYIDSGETAGEAIAQEFGGEEKSGGGEKKKRAGKGPRIETDSEGNVTGGSEKKMIGHTTASHGEFYHGTSATNVESILKHGIRPTDKTLGFKAAFVGQNKDLAGAYGAGNAAQNDSDEVAIVVVKNQGNAGFYSPRGAKNIAYKPGAIEPEHIDRIEIYRADAGKGEKPLRIISRQVSAKSRPAPPAQVQVNRLAAAFAEDLAPLRERLERILTIEDPDVLRAKLTAFRDSIPALLKDINADPEAARVLEDSMAAGMLKLLSPRRALESKAAPTLPSPLSPLPSPAPMHFNIALPPPPAITVAAPPPARPPEIHFNVEMPPAPAPAPAPVAPPPAAPINVQVTMPPAAPGATVRKTVKETIDAKSGLRSWDVIETKEAPNG